MKKIQHPKYGECYELTKPQDIAFAKMAQAALVKDTVLPGGTKTPSEFLWIREKFLVSREHAPPGAACA